MSTSFIKSCKHLFAIALLFFLICTSCNKQQLEQTEKAAALEKSKPLIESAKAYVVTLTTNNTATIKVNSVQKKPHTPKTITVAPASQFSHINKKIDWNNAEPVHIGNTDYIFVPIQENIKPFNNQQFEFFRYLVFSKTSSGDVALSVIEVLGDKGYSFTDQSDKIAIEACKNKFANEASAIGSVNASVFFYDKDYKQTASYKLTNGSWEAARISFRSDLDIKL
ncbi:MAG: hypothetical protein V4539_09240 [Bacteroidota bacterium]